MLPLYDTALADFNFGSIYSENSYTGRDRIADNHMVTLGLTTRYLNPTDGAEVARFGVAQRLRFADQRVGLGYDTLGQKGWSDILVGAGVNWNTKWSTDALVQYNRDTQRTARSAISGR
ncbi:LPS assembly protein LptD, partial [Streptomyces sp. AGS-58]